MPDSDLADSQPIRSAKRQKTYTRANLSSPSSRKPRRAGTAETARFQSVSQEGALSSTLPEIKDSYEEEISNESGRIRVEISVDDDFDRDAYAKISVDSSQPSQTSQSVHNSPGVLSRQSTQHSHNSAYTVPLSRFKTPRPRRGRFLWDEDLPSVIPDSQDLPGSSSFRPSEVTSSNTGTNSRPGTGISVEATRETPLRNNAANFLIDSSEVDHRRSEPPAYKPRRGLFKKELEIVSDRRESSAVPPSSGGLQRTSGGVSSLEKLVRARPSRSPSFERPATADPICSSQIQSAQVQSPRIQWSREEAQFSSQGQANVLEAVAGNSPLIDK